MTGQKCATGGQHVASYGEFVCGGSDVTGGIVKDELAVNPERGTGVGEVLPLDPALTDWRTGNALVETRESGTGAEGRSHQGSYTDFGEILSH